MDFEFTRHALDVLKERNILEEWVCDVIEKPDWKIVGNDGNMHYYKSVSAREGRFLHVVVNSDVEPAKVVTAFFDRRARRPR